MKDPKLLSKITQKIGNKLRKELISTASPSSGSCFRVNDLQSLSSFQWSILAQDLKRTAPLLCTILEKCVDANRCDVRKPNKDAIVAVIGGILLRNCSERVNMVQHIFSVLFYSSHVPKEVCVLVKFHVAKAIFVRCIIVFRNCFCVCHTSKQFLLLKNWGKSLMNL